MTNFELIDAILEDSVRNSVSYYGIEACEDVINRVYTQNPVLKARMLAVFNRLYRKNN